MSETSELDAATFSLMVSYFSDDPRVPREISVDVFQEFREAQWTLADFMSMLHDAIAQIPEQYRTSAVVTLRGEVSPSLSISFMRPETEIEVTENVNRALAYAREQQHKERRDYERLKKKFE